MFDIPSNDYLSDDDISRLEKSNDKYTNGFFVLFDIINSTPRKVSEHNWVEQTEGMYKLFKTWCQTTVNECENKKFKLIVYKFAGDGMMAYFKTSVKKREYDSKVADPELTNYFMASILSFLNYVNDKKDLFAGIILKTVATYLTNIRIININENERDVLGRGIDFSFRLERFADAGHIVINEMLNNSLNTTSDAFPTYDSIKCCKQVKGWKSDGETFYLFTETRRLRDAYELKIPSTSEMNVYLELFQWYIKNSQEKELNSDNKLNWETDEVNL